MKRHVLVAPLVVAFGVGIIALGGQKFWEKTEFPDWSKKEISQMLSKSPWARSVNIRLSGMQPGGPRADGGRAGAGVGGGGPGGAGGAGGGGGSPAGGAGGYGGQGSGGGYSGGRGGRGGGFSPSLSLMVRWYSALPIKQALAAHRYGREAQADENLKVEETHYTIGLSGVSGALFRGDRNFSKLEAGSDPWLAISERLKSESFLKISGREPIQAVEIQMRNAPELDVVDAREMRGRAEILVMFPRSQTITLEDKQVEFVSMVGERKLKKKFKLKEMVYNGKLEL